MFLMHFFFARARDFPATTCPASDGEYGSRHAANLASTDSSGSFLHTSNFPQSPSVMFHL